MLIWNHSVQLLHRPFGNSADVRFQLEVRNSGAELRPFGVAPTRTSRTTLTAGAVSPLIRGFHYYPHTDQVRQAFRLQLLDNMSAM